MNKCTRAELIAYVAAYPRPLERLFNAICEPAATSYFDHELRMNVAVIYHADTRDPVEECRIFRWPPGMPVRLAAEYERVSEPQWRLLSEQKGRVIGPGAHEGQVEVEWPGGVRSAYDAGWLCVAE